tara:strand:+ start:180648 stop:185162 length:4515 start_codon:yes stop_codon:yes gene_type:complete
MANATNYYFSNQSGNDSRSATEAQNPDTPWKSINKLNAIFSNLKPGDGIYFKRGEVFYGTIKVKEGGSPGNPIKIDAYGSGAKPIITSFEKVTGWKSIGNGRYESTNAFSNFESNIVTIGGQIYERGRYPNSDASNGGYLTISSSSGNSSVTSNELSSGSNYSNAEVVIRKNQWILDRHQINSVSGGKVNYNGSGAYSPSEGYGFFIQNHLSTLDKFGEWFYNSSRKLNVYFGNTNPNNREVLVSTLENLLVKDYNVDHILIQNLHFKGAIKDAIYIGEGKDIVLNNSEVEFSGENGITSLNISDLVIKNCRVNYSLNTGLNLRYGNDNAVIRDNIIENSFPFNGGSQNQDNNGNGILISGNNILIENNTIKQTGFNGIHFSGNNISIKNNLIQEFCLLKNDCGGIYTFGGKTITNFSNRVIESNIILDGLSTNNGTPHHESATHNPQGSGIFLDDNVNGVTVIKNTIANTNYSGIKASNNFNVTVKENTFYNSYIQALVGNSDRGADTRNVNFHENVFFSKYSDQYSYRINSFKDDLASFGSFNNNYFARPLGDNHSIYLSYYKNNEREIKIQDLNEWKKSFNKDLTSSIFEQNEVKPFSLIKFLGSWLYDNISFSKSIDDFNCNDCTQSWDSNGISGGSIKIKSPDYSSALVRIGSVKQDKSYVVKFKAKSNKSGSLRVVLRYAGSPWEVISPSTAVELGTDVKEYSVLIKPYADVESPVVMFISDVGNWEYWIDDLQIKEADVKVTNPNDVFLFEYNASKSSKSLTLDGTFKDTKGKSISGNIQIAPYSSVLLLKTSDISTTPPATLPPPVEQEIKISSPSTNSSYILGEEINIGAEVTPDIENINKIEFYNGDKLIGQTTNHPYKFTWKNGTEGTHQINAVLINNNNNKIATSSPISIKINSAEADGTPPSGDAFSLHINMGSNDSKSFDGKEFTNLSATDIKTGNYNSRDLDGSIYGSADFNEELYYRIPVPNGTYTLQTYHQEIHFGLDGVSGGKGKRVFSISVENQTKYDKLDLYTLNGNKEVLLTHENIVVTDGYMDISLTASTNNAIISAFSIIEKGVSNPVQPVEGAKYINVGGLLDVMHEGNKFVSDYSTKYYSNSGTSENTSATDFPIFETIRFAENLTYNIPVENGVYRVKTYHIENYFGAAHPDGKPGLRVFDIFLQNQLVKNNLDLYELSGNKETILVFDEIIVSNGELKIELKASVNNSLLSGIAIIPMSGLYDQLEKDSFFVNVGGEVDTYYKDINFVSESSITQIPSNSLKYNVPESSSDQLYQSNRYGKELGYKFPVSNGTYTVVTYHNENYFGEISNFTGPNNRVFDIHIENIKVKDNIDLYLENSNRPVALRFENIKVSDGILNLNLNAIKNNALLSGIAVFPSTKENAGNLNLRQIVSETEEISSLSELRENAVTSNSFKNKLYPNPAVTSTTLELGQDLGRFYISIHNFNGQLIDYFDSETLVNTDGNYNIPVHQLKQGVYIVTLSTESEVLERMKLSVTP